MKNLYLNVCHTTNSHKYKLNKVLLQNGLTNSIMFETLISTLFKLTLSYFLDPFPNVPSQPYGYLTSKYEDFENEWKWFPAASGGSKNSFSKTKQTQKKIMLQPTTLKQ